MTRAAPHRARPGKSDDHVTILRKLYHRMTRLLGAAPQDVANLIEYGRKGPIAGERIWIDPRDVRHVVAPHPAECGIGSDCPDYRRLCQLRARSRRLAGRVIGREIEEFDILPLSVVTKIEACRRRWQDGVSWEAAGAIDALMFKITTTGAPQSGCRTRQDVIQRYRKLDEIFETVTAEGRLRSRRRRKTGFLREPDGVQIHLGRNGALLFGATGTHRLAMARVLGLARIPASLGFVHESALDLLPGLRGADSPVLHAPIAALQLARSR